MFQNWLKIALINYRKNWLSTAINLFGLTVGLTGFMLILIHWQDEKSYESWNPNKEHIYMMENAMGSNFGVWSNATYGETYHAKKLLKNIEDYVLINPFDGNLRVTFGEKLADPVLMTTSDNFFNFFPFKKLAGSYKDIFKNPGVVAISSTTAQKLFGSDYNAAIGKTIKSEQSQYVVAAVYELPEGNSVIKPGILVRSGNLKGNEDNWGDYNFTAFFRIKDGVDPAKMETELTDMLMNEKFKKDAQQQGLTLKEYLKGAGTGKVGILLTNLADIKLEAKGNGIEKGNKKTIYTLLVLSIVIVLLSTINFINLKTAQASQRAKEVGVRKVLGSTRGQLIAQFLLEALLICVLAYIFSVALAEVFMPAYAKLMNKDSLKVSSSVYTYAAIMLLITTLFSGLIPAIYLANFKPINTLKGNFARSRHGVWLRNGILTLQLIISSFFIISTFVIYEQVNFMMNKDLGFSGAQVINIPFQKQTDEPWKKYELLKEQITKIAGVEDITYTKIRLGMGGLGSSGVNYLDKTIMADHGSIDLNFHKFFNIKMLAGRDFDPKLTSDTATSAVVNEAFVKEMGWKNADALGKKVKPGFDEREYTIIGVSKDFNNMTVAQKIKPIIFFNYGRNWNKFQINNVMVKLAPNDMPHTIENIKQFWQTKFEPGYPFSYEFVDKAFAKTYNTYMKQRTLFSILNAMVLIVALLGLFALSSLMIEQKLKDVAIKKTLGASDAVLIKDLTKKFLWVTIIAVVISMPIGYYFMNEWLKDFAYRIEMPWWPFVLSLVILVVLTFAVVSFKAYRATKVSLIKYLKYE